MSLCCKRHTLSASLAKDRHLQKTQERAVHAAAYMMQCDAMQCCNVDSHIEVLKSSVAPERTSAKACVTWTMQRQAVETVATRTNVLAVSQISCKPS